jgi:signal transduction histidine kinase
MSQLKNLAFTMMYIYIFVFALSERNILAVIVLILLGINYFRKAIRIKHYDKKLKKCLNLQREAFVNTLSHDLRIPIIAQIRALDILMGNKLGCLNDMQAEMISNVQDSGKCVLNLISLMINTYKIENNSYKFVYEKFNLADVIISCFDELLSQASEKNIIFDYAKINRNLCIVADKSELRKVILNLLLSSIISAKSGQRISVETCSINNKVRLSVSSSGENNLYTDINSISSYSFVGQKIRMGFCKKIIENHEGRILNNTGKNSFSFELPQACS